MCSIPGGKIGVCQVQTFSVLVKLKLLWSIFDKWCVYYTGAMTLVFLAQKQIAQGPKSALRPPSGTPTAFRLLSTKCRYGRGGCSKRCCQIFTSVFYSSDLGTLAGPLGGCGFVSQPGSGFLSRWTAVVLVATWKAKPAMKRSPKLHQHWLIFYFCFSFFFLRHQYFTSSLEFNDT